MPHDPKEQAPWFRLVRFRSPLLTESLRFLFLWLLRCFSSPGSLARPMYSAVRDRVLLCRVSPFGHLRIIASVLLPGAFRRLHVLHRQFVPRHSSRTLKSLFLRSKKFECSMHTLVKKTLCNFQRARRWPPINAMRHRSAAKENDTRPLRRCQAQKIEFEKLASNRPDFRLAILLGRLIPT